MRVALYLRRSTDDELQPESLNIQEDLLRAYAAENGHAVVRIFQDSASGRSLRRRVAFKAMLQAIEQGPDFDAVLVRDVSRWGRFEAVDESAYYEFWCALHGVAVVYVEEGFARDGSPFAELMKTLKRIVAAEFSRDRSRLVRRGQLRTTERGFLYGGPPPYGMRRILVDERGTEIANLRPGEWKVLANARVKLGPGDPAKVAVVRRIFHLFTEAKLTRKEIAATLNGERVPAPHGGKTWHIPAIAWILTNERYAGVALYGGKRSGNGPAARTPNSWEPVIAPELFARAQEQRASEVWNRSNERLANELRAHVAVHGHSDWERAPANFYTFQNRFGGWAEALRLAFSEEIAAIRREVGEALTKRFDVVEDDGVAWTIGRRRRVGLAFAWPRISPNGRRRWQFLFDRAEALDTTICVGFPGGPGDERTFFLVTTPRSKRCVFAPVSPAGARLRWDMARSRHLNDVIDALTRRLFANTEAARVEFLQACAGSEIIRIQDVARRLGWTWRRAEVVYERLRGEGYELPLRRRFKKGARVKVVCPGCGHTRSMLPNRAMELKTDYCARCYQARARRRVTAVCPQCGKERTMRPSKARRMKQGIKSLCHDCAMAKGRAQQLAAHAERRAVRQKPV